MKSHDPSAGPSPSPRRGAAACSLLLAGLIVTGFQLIHPRDYHAYYRAKADSEISNNFEELPGFS